VLSMAVAPVGATVADPVAQQQTVTPTPTQTANNTTTPSGPNGSTSPTAASQVRITPEKFDEPFLAVTVRESDSVFETTGPFALFTLSHEVEAARISQQPAEAQVLAGGTQVKVTYADDAAPPGETSLYTLELFFTDGSTKEIELYARQTGVSVGASELMEYAPVLEELRQLAEQHGYGTSPEELEAYLSWVNERADLIDGFLTKSAAQLMALAIAASMNWLFWLLLLGLIALVAVPAVGSNAVYWRDGHGVRSAGQLARMAAFGAHRQTEDGLVQVHNGVDDLDTESLEDSWLEPVLRSNRIPTAKQALGEIKATLEHMETKHNLGHLYRDARDDVAQLIQEVEEEDQMMFGPGNAGTGGDD